MPRPSTRNSIDEILRDAMEPVLKRASASIAKAIAEMAAARLDRELQNGIGSARARRGAGARAGRGARRRSDITRWAADRRARRVPKFVIEMTNLDTKKKIVAKYGPDAVFEKGKALPKPK